MVRGREVYLTNTSGNLILPIPFLTSMIQDNHQGIISQGKIWKPLSLACAPVCVVPEADHVARCIHPLVLNMNILLYCHWSHYHLALMELFAPFHNLIVVFIFFSNSHPGKVSAVYWTPNSSYFSYLILSLFLCPKKASKIDIIAITWQVRCWVIVLGEV